MGGCSSLRTVRELASFPGALGNWGEERLVSTVTPGIHCSRMREQFRYILHIIYRDT